MSNIVAAIVAHPDDEVLGCGGSIAKHIAEGDEAHVLIMSEGITSRDQNRDAKKRQSELDDLKQAASTANNILGTTSLQFAHFPDNRMDSVDLLDVIKVVEQFLKSKKPSHVYTHHSSDVNIDHQIVHQAVVTAMRPLPNVNFQNLLFFEVLSSTEWQVSGVGKFFQPNWYIDVSSTIAKKVEAMKAYHAELCDWPHSRSIQGITSLAQLRGCSVGVEAAEAFVLGRCILR